MMLWHPSCCCVSDVVGSDFTVAGATAATGMPADFGIHFAPVLEF
jgi:hypothetical protein